MYRLWKIHLILFYYCKIFGKLTSFFYVKWNNLIFHQCTFNLRRLTITIISIYQWNHNLHNQKITKWIFTVRKLKNTLRKHNAFSQYVIFTTWKSKNALQSESNLYDLKTTNASSWSENDKMHLHMQSDNSNAFFNQRTTKCHFYNQKTARFNL